jgi:hypothetical protein
VGRATQVTQATPEPTPVPTATPDGVVLGVAISQVLETLGAAVADGQGVADAVAALLAQDMAAATGRGANATAGAALSAGILDYATRFNVSVLMGRAFAVVPAAWDASAVSWTSAAAPNPSPRPTQEPTASPVPTDAPTGLPSAAPTPLPSAAPTLLPSQAPSWLPSATPLPSGTPRPSPRPSSEPTPNRAPSICRAAANASCGSVFYHVANGSHAQVMGSPAALRVPRFFKK